MRGGLKCHIEVLCVSFLLRWFSSEKYGYEDDLTSLVISGRFDHLINAWRVWATNLAFTLGK